MNRITKALIVGISAVLLIGASVAAVHSHGWRHGRFGHMPLFRMMHKLDLTDSQKAMVAGILKSNEATLRQDVTTLVKARVALNTAILNGNDVGDPIAAVQAASGSLISDSARLRVSLFTALKPTLSESQQITLTGMESRMENGKVDARITEGFEQLDKWIAKHGQ